MFDNKVLMITGAQAPLVTVLRRFLDTAVREIRIFFARRKKQEGHAHCAG